MGIGLSTRAPRHTLSDWAADVVEFADALGLERFAVVGVSAGGSYALALGHAVPDRVSRVGLVCAMGPILDHPEFDDDFNHPLRALLPVAREDADAAEALLRQFLAPLGERYRADPEAFFEEWLQGWPADQQVLYRKYKSRWMPAIEATHRDTDGYADDIVAALHWTFDPGEIHVPVRSWHGTLTKRRRSTSPAWWSRRPAASWCHTRASGTTSDPNTTTNGRPGWSRQDDGSGGMPPISVVESCPKCRSVAKRSAGTESFCRVVRARSEGTGVDLSLLDPQLA